MGLVPREFAFSRDMRGQPQTRGPDASIGALAGRQHGVVARRQLLAMGIGPDSIDRRVTGGRLHRMHRGVYAVGHQVLTREARWMAAVLSAGPRAVLSHRSAAALWGIRPTSRPAIEVTVPTPLRPRPGLQPHCAVLREDEVTVKDGIPVTTAARTQLDLASVLRPHELDRALNEAEIRRLEGPERLLRRHRRARGTKTLRALLVDARRSTNSPLESEFLPFLDAYGFARPETNTIVEGYECDAVWREARLIVELDGYAVHGTRRSFDEDRRRDRRLLAKGWRPTRFTSRQLDDPASAAAELAALGAPRL
jgi:very-short-patch-repair endonuclease